MTQATQQKTLFYFRSVDSGKGKQFAEVSPNGTIVNQWLKANQGHYTGGGNPELVGQKAIAMGGMGFKRVSEFKRLRMLEDSLIE